MQKLRALYGGLSPIAVTALLSVIVLGGVSVARVVIALRPPVVVETKVAEATVESSEPTPEWQQEMLLLGRTTSTNAGAATTTDHLAMIGPMIVGEILGTYDAFQAKGDYTQDDLRGAAAKIAVYMKAAVSFDAFENSDFKTDADVSTARVQTYRDELLKALAPIDAVGSAEYEIYGRYVETSDPQYLQQLDNAAAAYQSAALNASRIEVPRDAINYHRELLNSLRAFSSVLDGLVDHADDPFASVALLRTYNEKEREITETYQAMRSYFAKKSL